MSETASPTPHEVRPGQLDGVDDYELFEHLRSNSIKATADLLGCSRHSIYRRRQRPSYQKVVKEMRREVALRIVHQAAADVQLALDTVRKICKDSVDDHAKLNAARLLLTVHDNGKAPESIEDAIPYEDRVGILDRVKQATEGALRTKIEKAKAQAQAAGVLPVPAPEARAN